MKKNKELIEQVLFDVANSCHKKDRNDNYDVEIRKIRGLYEFIKEQLKNMEEDISLYRYKPINTYAKEEIEKQKIFMNIPSKFDDLFDSNCVVDIDLEPNKEYAPLFHALYLSKYMDENLHKLSQISDTNGWDDYFKHVNTDIDKLIRVSSLAEDYNNIPLWYYYANQHKGICIEYSLKEIVKRLRENEYIMPVVYTDNYFKYNPATGYTLDKRELNIRTNVLVKHDSWKFEKEWRIVQIRKKNCRNHTRKIPIKSVIFGLNVDKYDKRELKNLNKGIEFYELKRTCYGLKRVKVTEK